MGGYKVLSISVGTSYEAYMKSSAYGNSSQWNLSHYQHLLVIALYIHQIQLVGDLVEALVSACSTRVARDVTSTSSPASQVPQAGNLRATSAPSQSAADQPESELSLSESMSSTSFSQIQVGVFPKLVSHAGV